MKTIKGIIFDVDGVIIDTEDIHFSAYQKVLKKHGFNLTFGGYKKWFSGKSIEGGVNALQEEKNIVFNLPEIKKGKISSTKNIFQSQLKFYQDSINFIYKIYKGGMKLKDIGVVSTNPVLAIATGLEKTLIDEMFTKDPELKNIFSVTTVTEDYQHSKPHPECYLTTAEKMNINTDYLIGIEDSASGVTALNKAGIFSIGLTTTHTSEELKNAKKITDSLISLVD